MASILVCGGGNAAQVSSTLFAPRNKVYAISLYADEAERWSKAVEEAGHMACTLVGTDGKNKVIQGTPDKITNDPSVVADCDVVLFTVPSSFHDQYFEALAPHVKDGTIFAVMPARSGCDFLFQKIMGAKAKKLGLMAFETLPWACRFNEWGKTSTVLGIKETIGAAVQPPEGMTALEAMLKVQGVLGVHPMIVEYPNIMSISLGNPGQVVHPGITYSRWHNWDGEPLKEKPLFYQGADDFTQEVLMGISDDIQVICKALTAIDPHFDTSMVKTIYGWYMASYGTQCTDVSSLQAAMRTNPGYAGLTHPMKGDAEAGYTPDFHYRYLTEDVPTGLCFTKGVADLLEVHTPTIDKVVQWAQEKLGKEFLVDGKMTGKDIGYTRAPQAQGFATKEALLKFLGIGHGKAVHKIVFLRHGESEWNVKNIFTGWHDVDLSETGKQEAVEAGKMLKDAHFKFDVVFTSVLKRAIKTAWTACSESDNYSMPMIQSWRLNERHYGALQGLNKAETAAKHGEEQVKIWRRSYDIPPPAIAQADSRHPSNDPLYASVPQDALPGAESLKLTVDRVLPFWFDTIAPVVLAGKSVLVAAHGNSLRAICKYLEGMSEAEVLEFNIPTAVPLVYELDSKLKFVRKYYLMDPEEVAKKVAAVANQGKAK